MASKKKTSASIKAETKSPVRGTSTTKIAANISATIGRTRKGRDRVTRVTSPIKVVDTNARQWNRYGP